MPPHDPRSDPHCPPITPPMPPHDPRSDPHCPPLQALELNPSLQFVRPRWVLLCAERLRPLPPQPYAVVPRDVTVTSP